MPLARRLITLLVLAVARLVAVDTAAPEIDTQPADITEKGGGIASFFVTARGAGLLRYQWYHDGAALSGETGSILHRTPLSAIHAGRYTVSVSNAVGTVLSSAAQLVVEPALSPVVDPTFRVDPALEGTPTALLPLPDGALLVHTGSRLSRLLQDGSLDPAWPSHTFTRPVSYGPNPFPVDLLVRQPDGRILVGGTFIRHNDIPRANLLRLNADGSLDGTFSPAASIALSNLRSLAVQRDGRIVLAAEHPTPFRLLPNGALDSSFRPHTLEPPVTNLDPQPWVTLEVGLTADDRIFVARRFYVAASNRLLRVVYDLSRLLANGSLDTSFTPYTGYNVPLYVTAEGGALASSTLLSANGQQRFTKTSLTPLLAYPDGAFIYQSSNLSGPARITATGEPDPTFVSGFGRITLAARDYNGRLLVAGAFDTYDSQPARRIARLTTPVPVSRNAPRITALVADRTVARANEAVTFRAAVTGSSGLEYRWVVTVGNIYQNGGVTTGPEVSYRFSHPPGTRVTIRLTATDNARVEVSASIDVTMLPAGPSIASQTGRVSTQSGRDLTLSVTRHADSSPVTYEWRRNGELLPFSPAEDGTTFLYRIPNITAAAAGAYTLTLRDVEGRQVTSAPIPVSVDASSRFVNLSTLGTIHGSEPQVIAGFTISGAGLRRVLVRGIGPGLAQFGVASPLPDPVITLYDSAGRVRSGATSDNWAPALAPSFAALGAYRLEPGSADAAFVADLPSGSYTVSLTGKPGQTGTALVEVYEADNDAQTVSNLSTRTYIAPGAPAIAGLVVRGPGPKAVLVRAIGPSLAQFTSGVANPLPNPRLTLRDANGAIVAANDDWGTPPDSTVTTNAFAAAGAFALAPGTRDAALARPALPPGNYTAVVESSDGQSGVALLEIYEY